MTTMAIKLPDNTTMVGLVIEREFQDHVPGIVAMTPNPDMAGILSAWCNLPHEFIVVAGQPSSRVGRIVGGTARHWPDGEKLFRLVLDRMSELAGKHGDFNSAWVLLVSPERRAILERVSAAFPVIATRH